MATKWNNYCKNLLTFSQSPESLDVSEDSFKALLGATENVTSKIMNDDIVQNALQTLLTLRKSLVNKNCSNVSTEFTQYLKQAIANLDKLVQDKPNVGSMFKCIKMNALFVLSSNLFGNNDKKVFKSLIELNTKVCLL